MAFLRVVILGLLLSNCAAKEPLDPVAVWGSIENAKFCLQRIWDFAVVNATVPIRATCLRYAFHDAGTYDKDKDDGGANGSIVRELSDSHNVGLRPCADQLIGNILNMLSDPPGGPCDVNAVVADVVQVAGAVMVYASGGPACPVIMGRHDRPSDDNRGKDSPLGLPDGCSNVDTLIAGFTKNGFKDPLKSLVVLSGAHNIGQQRSPNSVSSNCSKGVGPLTPTNTQFDNGYYKLINGPRNDSDPAGGAGHFHSDNELVNGGNDATKALVVQYASNGAAFATDWCIHYSEMSLLGVDVPATFDPLSSDWLPASLPARPLTPPPPPVLSPPPPPTAASPPPPVSTTAPPPPDAASPPPTVSTASPPPDAASPPPPAASPPPLDTGVSSPPPPSRGSIYDESPPPPLYVDSPPPPIIYSSPPPPPPPVVYSSPPPPVVYASPPPPVVYSSPPPPLYVDSPPPPVIYSPPSSYSPPGNTPPPPYYNTLQDATYYGAYNTLSRLVACANAKEINRLFASTSLNAIILVPRDGPNALAFFAYLDVLRANPKTAKGVRDLCKNIIYYHVIPQTTTAQPLQLQSFSQGSVDFTTLLSSSSKLFKNTVREVSIKVLDTPSSTMYAAGVASGATFQLTVSSAAAQGVLLYQLDDLLLPPSYGLSYPAAIKGYNGIGPKGWNMPLSAISALNTVQRARPVAWPGAGKKEGSLFYSLLFAVDVSLQQTLSNRGAAYTLLVPTNAAIQAYLNQQSLTLYGFPQALLRHHIIISRALRASGFNSNGASVTYPTFPGSTGPLVIQGNLFDSAQPPALTEICSQTPTGPRSRPIQIAKTDVIAGKSVVHYINNVLDLCQ